MHFVQLQKILYCQCRYDTPWHFYFKGMDFFEWLNKEIKIYDSDLNLLLIILTTYFRKTKITNFKSVKKILKYENAKNSEGAKL